MPETAERVCELHWPDEKQLAELQQGVSSSAGVPLSSIRTVFSPYRVCPLGAHVDHQGGVVSASAISGGVVLCFTPTHDGSVQLTSSSFGGQVAFNVDSIPPAKRGTDATEPCNWGNFPRGAAFAFAAKGYKLTKGLRGHLWSPASLDSSGISSSAAVGVAYIMALAHANGIELEQADVIEVDRVIENEYLGLRNGILDQSAIVLSGPGTALTVIDCRACSWRQVTPPWEFAGSPCPFRVLLAFSGLREALASGASFNTRVAECVEAAKQLRAITGNGPAEPVLGDFTYDQFTEHEAQLDDTSARRARHFSSETRRVTAGATAWEEGNLQRFGQLMCQSGLSSINNYQVGTPHLITLQQILHNTPGVYGARFSGAGTRGACVALVESSRVHAVAVQVLQQYLEQYPEMSEAAHVVVTDFGPGAWLQ